MEMNIPPSEKRKRIAILCSAVLAFVLVFSVVQVFIASASGVNGESARGATDANHGRDPYTAVITHSTGLTEELTFDEALKRYVEGHTLTEAELASLRAQGLVAPADAVAAEAMYFPIVFRALPTLALQASRPNSANSWTLAWEDGGPNLTYQLQESQDPGFAGATTFDMGTELSRTFTHTLSTQNVYYYRLRTLDGSQIGLWSEPVRVVGGYRDDFTSNSSGWRIRRTTFIEEVRTFYEIDSTNSWLIMQVEDSWDWGIASPGAPAPAVPYAIEYRARVAHRANLVSFGAVFGGDWPGAICPDPSTVAGWYEHELCFNDFYNTNTIWFGDLKLLFERVDELVWCPTCGGSPMKRLGDIDANNTADLSNVDPDGWNTYRIEVRESGIRFYANNSLQFQYSDTRHIHQPYFGVFASTDEYSNSTTRFEYYQIIPLDS